MNDKVRNRDREKKDIEKEGNRQRESDRNKQMKEIDSQSEKDKEIERKKRYDADLAGCQQRDQARPVEIFPTYWTALLLTQLSVCPLILSAVFPFYVYATSYFVYFMFDFHCLSKFYRNGVFQVLVFDQIKEIVQCTR